MKNYTLLVFAIFFTNIAFCKNINLNEISIPDNFKVEDTFSGNLSDTNSFHLIFTKDKETKNYTIFSYLYDGENIKNLPGFTEEEPLSIVSFHQKNNILSLLLTYSIKKKPYLKTVHYNLVTNEKTASEAILHDDFVTSIRTIDESILIYKSVNSFKIKSYAGNSLPLTKELNLLDNLDVKKFFNQQSVTSIKTDEFVANGATNTVRLYYEDNSLFFTRDSDEPIDINVIGFSLNNKKANITQLLKFDLNSQILTPKFSSYENANGEKFKKATSFFSNNMLFQLALSKKEGFINIIDINSGNIMNNIVLNASMSKFVKGNPEFDSVEDFLNNAGKNKYNATITANKTTTDKIRVRLDYVDINYRYTYDWWWFHQQFMWQMQQHNMQIMQQNIQRNIPRGFGPYNDDDFIFATKKIEKRFFEIIIDINGNLVQEELPELLFKEIDKEIYIKNLEEIDKYKYESSCFLNNSFRFIAYDLTNRKFIIETKKLND